MPVESQSETTAMSDVETRVLEVLEQLGLSFERIEIEPEYADTADFCQKYGYEPATCANTIVVASKRGPKRFSACVVRGSDRLDVNRTVRRLMEVSRASFASAGDTVELTGMAIGGVTVFALPPEVPVYVDSKVMTLDYVILGSGSRSSKIKISPVVFHEVPNAQIVEGLSRGV